MAETKPGAPRGGPTILLELTHDEMVELWLGLQQRLSVAQSNLGDRGRQDEWVAYYRERATFLAELAAKLRAAATGEEARP